MSIQRTTFLLSLALAACAPLAARAQQPACITGNVQTSSGPVCGKLSPITIPNAGSFTANAYLGIPYAQPPVGALRWQNPVAPNFWTTPLQATEFANECPQRATVTQGVCSFTTSDQNEDCLYLNVWTPTGATPTSKLPVLVFIHGGAFVTGTGGSSTSDLFDGTYLAASQNVLVVTFNYRLGALGFLATADMPSGVGNFGFRDQLLALNWVQQNIASFGGDPSQVLLFGESAGAMSVGLHTLSSSQSAGLFKAALMESNPLGIPYKTLQQAQTLGQTYSSLFTCSDLSCLRQQSACELVAQETSPSLVPPLITLSSMLPWSPVIDGSLISGQPMANAANLKVPMLMGTNRDEGVLFAALMAQRKPEVATPLGYSGFLGLLFGLDGALKIESNSRYRCLTAPCTTQLANVITDSIFTCANRQFAIQAASAQNLYMYLFKLVSSFNLWAPPNPTVVTACNKQVCHGDELPYVFNTAQALNHTFVTQEETLSQTMGAYWASFAKSQSPGSSWPLFGPNKTYMLLNANSSTASDPLNATANCDSLWGTIGYQDSAFWDRLLTEVRSPKKKAAH